MRICGICSMNDGTVYTSMPPKYKCTVTNEFYLGDHPCHLDLVPVVRCGECAIWDTDGYGKEYDDEGFGWCDHIERTTDKDWYCADGKRKGEEDER